MILGIYTFALVEISTNDRYRLTREDVVLVGIIPVYKPDTLTEEFLDLMINAVSANCQQPISHFFIFFQIFFATPKNTKSPEIYSGQIVYQGGNMPTNGRFLDCYFFR